MKLLAGIILVLAMLACGAPVSVAKMDIPIAAPTQGTLAESTAIPLPTATTTPVCGVLLGAVNVRNVPNGENYQIPAGGRVCVVPGTIGNRLTLTTGGTFLKYCLIGPEQKCR